MMLCCLAIDPGPTYSGVAAVAFHSRRFEFGDGWHLEFGGGYCLSGGTLLPERGVGCMSALFRDAAAAGSIVAVERVDSIYEMKSGPQLLETTRTEGQLIRLANAHGITPVTVAAREWRGALCRRESPQDDEIAVVVDALVVNAPRELPKEKRQHIYDAIGLAVVVLARAAGMRLPLELPPEVEAALFRCRAELAAKKSLKAQEKRGPTRAQRARRSDASRKGWAKRGRP